MQQRCLSFLLEFNWDIHHLPGAENVVADPLSRPGPDPDTVDVLSTLSLLLHLQFQEYPM